MPVTKEKYGHINNTQLVERYTLTNENGMILRLINYGATVTELWVPDRNNKVSDVVLGWEEINGYQKNDPYLGVVVGRVANRIAKGHFTLNDQKYELAINNGPNHLHGGIVGFHKVVWTGSIEANDSVRFTYLSHDGEEGYPGELNVSVTYQLTQDNRVVISYVATATKPTPVNLTNHSYFNLGGHDSGSVLDHEITIAAESYTPVDDTSIPTGEIAPVKNTVFDLQQPTKIGARIHDVPGLGYDHNYCFTPSLEKPFARVFHQNSGRCLEAFTTMPGVQFYTGNYLSETMTGGKGGARYPKHSGLALEAQYYPDSVNRPNFPNCILNPGETYEHRTIYKFSSS